MTFTLSTSQQAVVDHRGSPLQVIACAGSGKTESISRRVASLIVEGNPPESIVAFTFTEKAAAELKERIYKRVEEAKGTDFLGRLGPMFVGTVHAYCFRILQDHVPKYGNYDVLDEHRHSALISRWRYELDLAKLHQKVWKSIEIFLRAADVIEKVTQTRPELLTGYTAPPDYAVDHRQTTGTVLASGPACPPTGLQSGPGSGNHRGLEAIFDPSEQNRAGVSPDCPGRDGRPQPVAPGRGDRIDQQTNGKRQSGGAGPEPEAVEKSE